MKQAIKELHLGRNKDKNIEIFTNGMRNLYQKYSYVELAMLQYIYYECSIEEEQQDEFNSLYQQVNEIIRHHILAGNPLEEKQKAIENIESIRKNVIHRMQEVTGYIDGFSLFEHILNRVEYRFKPEQITHTDDEEEITRQAMRYILEQDDNATVNSRISQVIGQLPVRMTKGRFRQLLEEGIDVYETTDKQSFDDFLYMLRTSTTIDFKLCDKPYLEEVTGLYHKLKQIDFAHITREEYKMAKDSLMIATQTLNGQVDCCMRLQEIINHVYVILLGERADDSSKEVQNSMAVLSMIDGKWKKQEKEEFDEKEESLLISLEGCQEALYEKFMKYDYVTDELVADADVVQNDVWYQKILVIKHIRDLISDSLFVEWQENENQELTKAYFEEKKQRTLSDFDSFFASHPKWENRAVMAIALSEIPVFFSQITQVQDYIYQSLKNCGDMAEKQVVMELLKELAES